MKQEKHVLSKFWAFFAIVVFAGIAVTGHAQVNQEELQNLPPVTFINYEGPHARIDTREQIRQLGVVLGQEVSERERGIASDLETMSYEQRSQYSSIFQIGALNRYFVIHCISGPEDGKLDADIFGLGVDAGVDHIRNLRTIIQGYLQSAYDYSESDAALLAEYITIYNAVYRGNWEYFESRYKSLVISNLIRDRAGLSIRYDEWPGRTMMLIPLGQGGLSAIDTSAITDRRVIEELRREEDQGVPQRQGMVDLMEREADQAEQRAQIEREVIRQEERQIAEERGQTTQERQEITQERQDIEQERQDIAQERQDIEQERQDIAQERQDIAEERQKIEEDLQEGRITEEEASQLLEELDRREQELDQKEQELDQKERELEQRERDAGLREEENGQRIQTVEEREQEIARREEELDQRREEAQRLEDFAEQKFEEAQEQREEIARDQQEAILQETTGGIIAATIERENPPMGRLVRINPATKEELRRSPLDTVHTRTITFIAGKILAVAGENRGPGAVRLIEINQESLVMAKQGEDDIRAGSLLWVNGNDIYAITTDLSSSQCFIGRFNPDLVLLAKSSARVHPEATVIIQQGRLLTQNENGNVLVLNPADLTEF